MVKLTLDSALVTAEAVKSVYYVKDEFGSFINTPGGSFKERVLPFGIKSRILKIKDVLEENTSKFFPKREELIRKYGVEVTLDKKGKPAIESTPEDETQKVIQVPEDKMADWNKEINEILSQEEEYAYDKLSKADLAKLEEERIDLTDIQVGMLLKNIFE